MNAKILKTVLVLSLIFLAVGCDRISKDYVQDHLDRFSTVNVVGNIFVIRYAENDGAFLGLGSNLPVAFKPFLLIVTPMAAMVGLFIFVFLSFVMKNRITGLEAVAISLIIGGGIGNLIDRIFNNGVVIDFMNFGIGGLRTGILNVADLCVTLGVSILLIDQIRKALVGRKAEAVKKEQETR